MNASSWRRRTCLAMLLVLPLGFASGCGKTGGEEVRIGLIVPLTSPPFEITQRHVRQAAEMALKEINARGGVRIGDRSRPIAWVLEDSLDRPDAVVAVTRRLIHRDRVVAIIGPLSSRMAIPAGQVAEQERVPMLLPLASSPEVTAGKRYVFRASFTDEFQGRALTQFARETIGARRAAVLFDASSSYNRGLAEIFRGAFAEAGGQVVAFESYAGEVEDYRPQLARIQASSPEVLFLPNYAHEVSRQARQARELGLTSTFLGSDTWSALSADDRQHLEGSIYSDEWQVDAAPPGAQGFVEGYRRAYGEDPLSAAALTYDSALLMTRAIEAGGRVDGESIRQQLAAIRDHKGVTGVITFDGRNDPQKAVAMIRLKGGEARFDRWIEP